MQETDKERPHSENVARSGGVFIKYPVLVCLLIGTILLVVGSAYYSSSMSGKKPCEKAYSYQRARGAEYVDVKRQFISQGWSIESDEKESDLVTHKITFSRCK